MVNSDMEDAHTHILSLPEDANCAFLAVYDGHGGKKTMISIHEQIVLCLV
jgi:serine/threonine protein phosphatase PrpC